MFIPAEKPVVVEDATLKRDQIWRLMRLASSYYWHLAGALLAVLGEVVLGLSFPVVIGLLIDRVFVARQGEQFTALVSLLLAAFLGIIVCNYIQTYLSNYAGEKIVLDLRSRLYAHMQDLPLSFHDQQRTGDLLSRLGNDIAQIQGSLTTQLVWAVQSVLTAAGSIIVVTLYDWRLLILTVLAAGVVLLSSYWFGQRFEALSKRAAEEMGKATTIVEETLSNQRVVKSFGREQYEKNRYQEQLKQTFSFMRRLIGLESRYSTTVSASLFLVTLVVVLYGGLEVLQGRLSAGQLVAIVIMLESLTWPLSIIAGYYTDLSKALGAASRLFSILAVENTIRDQPGAPAIPPLAGHISFEQVGFAYRPQQTVLQDISFEARPGQVVALVGPSGAGKTTIASLLLRLYDVTEGRILVDGYDIRQVRQQSLRQQMALVPQETALFGGSIRENIIYGHLEASEEEVIEAARAANAHEFILSLPDGYNTTVGERGVRLSGGQRQRIAIARAFLRRPRLLILDEATSALDSENEALIQDALGRLMRSCTTIMITHRLTSAQQADRIIVLASGRVIEEGTHDELMQREGLYRDLYRQATEQA